MDPVTATKAATSLDFMSLAQILGVPGALLGIAVFALWKRQTKMDNAMGERLVKTEAKLDELQTGVIKDNTDAFQAHAKTMAAHTNEIKALRRVVSAVPCAVDLARGLDGDTDAERPRQRHTPPPSGFQGGHVGA